MHQKDHTSLSSGVFFMGMEGWYDICKSISVIHYINKMKDKITWSYEYAEKTFAKIQQPFMLKNSQQSGIRRNIPKHNKGYM